MSIDICSTQMENIISSLNFYESAILKFNKLINQYTLIYRTKLILFSFHKIL